jgi:hypothetical protein
MTDNPKVSATKNSGLQDDHDPSDIGQREANKRGMGGDDREQGQPLDKRRAQLKKGQLSQMEGPAAYAPRNESEKNPPAPKNSSK